MTPSHDIDKSNNPDKPLLLQLLEIAVAVEAGTLVEVDFAVTALGGVEITVVVGAMVGTSSEVRVTIQVAREARQDVVVKLINGLIRMD